jgi:hypothetical protein
MDSATIDSCAQPVSGRDHDVAALKAADHVLQIMIGENPSGVAAPED